MLDDRTGWSEEQWQVMRWQETLRHLLREHTGQAWDVRAFRDGVNVKFACLWLGVSGGLLCSWRRCTPEYFVGVDTVGIEAGIKIDAEQLAALWRRDIQKMQAGIEGARDE